MWCATSLDHPNKSTDDAVFASSTEDAIFTSLTEDTIFASSTEDAVFAFSTEGAVFASSTDDAVFVSSTLLTSQRCTAVSVDTCIAVARFLVSFGGATRARVGVPPGFAKPLP